MCSVAGCDRAHYGKGFCQMHYARNRRHGDPLTINGTPPGSTSKWLREVALKWNSDDCLPYPFATGSHGYGEARIDGEVVCAHVFVCESVHGTKPSPDHEVAHDCKMKICVNGLHLRWDTRLGNMRDKFRDGTIVRGEEHPIAKLDEKSVLAIRTDTRPQPQIAESYGISRTNVSAIKTRRSWAWL